MKWEMENKKELEYSGSEGKEKQEKCENEAMVPEKGNKEETYTHTIYAININIYFIYNRKI